MPSSDRPRARLRRDRFDDPCPSQRALRALPQGGFSDLGHLAGFLGARAQSGRARRASSSALIAFPLEDKHQANGVTGGLNNSESSRPLRSPPGADSLPGGHFAYWQVMSWNLRLKFWARGV